jgi:hypothetical protein
MDEDFKDELFGFIESLLTLENLVCKKVNGKNLKCGEFLKHIEENMKKSSPNEAMVKGDEKEQGSKDDCQDSDDNFEYLMQSNMKDTESCNNTRDSNDDHKIQVINEFVAKRVEEIEKSMNNQISSKSIEPKKQAMETNADKNEQQIIEENQKQFTESFKPETGSIVILMLITPILLNLSFL